MPISYSFSLRDMVDSIDAALEFTKTWDWRILEAGKIENISADQRTEYINSLTFLKEELGENFPKKFNINHPFFQKILRKVSKNGLWVDNVTPFVNTFRYFKAQGNSGYEKLMEKFTSTEPDRHREGMYFVDVAQSLLRAGLNVRFLEESGNTKVPDIKVINTDNDDIFFIEITRLNLSDKQKRYGENLGGWSNPLHRMSPDMKISGKQLQLIPLESMPALLNKLRHAVETAYQQKSFDTYKDEYVDVAFAHSSKESELQAWCEINGLAIGLMEGTPTPLSEIQRICNKIFEKMDERPQLPRSHAGLLYIRMEPMCFMDANSMSEAIHVLTIKINRYSNLGGIVLYSLSETDSEEQRFTDGKGDFYGRKMVDEITTRDLLFVCNHKADTMLKPETIKKIIDSFM